MERPLTLRPAEAAGARLSFYLGPTQYDLLKSYKVGLEKSVDLGWKIFHPLAALTLGFMNWLYRWLPNYGLIIILLSVLTKVAFYPLTVSSTRSMKRMQEVQPKMKALQEKYKGNQEKLSQEMMKLYKEEKINPMGGCLPMLLQMPVFVALYQVLRGDIALRQAPFVGWINDLGQPDALFHLPFGLPFFGNEFNLLPTPDGRLHLLAGEDHPVRAGRRRVDGDDEQADAGDDARLLLQLSFRSGALLARQQSADDLPDLEDPRDHARSRRCPGMSDAMEFKGRTVEDAISEALLRLGARRDEIEIEVLDKGKAGLLGLFGGKPARVKVSRKVMRKTDGAARRDAPTRPRGGEERSRDSRGRGREGRDNREGGPRTIATPAARATTASRGPPRAAAAPARAPVAGSMPGDRDRDRDGNAAAGGERTRRRRGGRGRGRGRSEGEGAPRVEPVTATSPPVAEAPRPFSPPAVIPSPTVPVVAVPPAVVPPPVAALPPAVSPLPSPAPSPSSVPVAVSPPAAAGFGALMAAAELVTPLRDVPEAEAPAAIQKLTAELMARAGFPCRVEVRPGEYHAVRIMTDESSAALLIGRNGATIDAIEHLVERMASQAVGAHVHMNLDVNNYRRRREERLVQRAQEIAARVLRSGEQESLESLPARERRVVHLEVAKVSGVQTFTVMNEEGKHVVVAPAGATPPDGVATGSGADADHAEPAEGADDSGAKPETASGGRSDPPDAPAL